MPASFLFRRLATPLVLAVFVSVMLTPAIFAHPHSAVHPLAPSFVGPKHHYLALGDSLAYGYQPDLDFDDGYVHDFSNELRAHGVEDSANLGCPGETSVTLIKGGCPASFLRKFPYIGSQLKAALLYLALFRGNVSPVTLDIGANDVLPDINKKTCTIDTGKFQSDLATLDSNLKETILPQLHDALTVNGEVTGDLLLANYYDPYQNICPNTLPYVQIVNQHLADDINGYGTIVDVFSAFGGATTPNPNICSYSWICSIFHDIHPKEQGYSVIAQAFENTTGY